MQTVLLIIAAIIILINLILTIQEAKHYYHVYFPSAAHPGRIRGACEPGPEGNEKTKGTGWVEIDGMKYSVEWYLIGRKKDEKDGK